MQNNNPAMWADHYESNFSAFPLKPHSKKPDLPSWLEYQTSRASIEQIAAWVDNNPSCNIGIATGAVSGIIVLDLDSAAAAAIAEERGIPPTVEAVTPRGRHVYFRHPGHPVANITGRDGGALPRGIDVRGDGGYVVAPGSYFVPSVEERADGKKEGAYAWRSGHSPADIAYAIMPDWLSDAMTKPALVAAPQPMAASRAPLPTGNTTYGLAALQGECDEVQQAPKGTRNHRLNIAAVKVATLVAGGELDDWDARQKLASAATMSGLDQAEITKTINSGWRHGTTQPRTAPEPVSFCSVMPISAPVDPLGEVMCATDLSRMTPPPREWLVDQWLPVGATTTLFGDGGVGKSLVAMQIAAAVATGKDLWSHKTSQAPVLSLYCEDDADELARRQQAINASMELEPSDLGALYCQSRFGLQSLLGTSDKRTGAYQTNDLFSAITTKASNLGARLVILDNIHMVYGGEANDPGAVTRFMASLNRLALDINGAVILLGHIAKAEGSRYAGTTAWSNASRNRLFFGRPDNASEAARNPDLRRLSRDKSNYAKAGEELDLMWDKGAFVRPSDLSPSLGLTNDQARDDRAFLDQLDELTANKQALSIAKQATNYAPRIMARDGRYRSADMDRRMTAAMGRLLSAGAIVEEADLPWQTRRRVAARGIARAPAGTMPTGQQAALSVLEQLERRLI